MSTHLVKYDTGTDSNSRVAPESKIIDVETLPPKPETATLIEIACLRWALIAISSLWLVFAVKNTRSPKQDELRFHDNYPNHETSPVSCAFMNASFGEFQQILASSGDVPDLDVVRSSLANLQPMIPIGSQIVTVLPEADLFGFTFFLNENNGRWVGELTQCVTAPSLPWLATVRQLAQKAAFSVKGWLGHPTLAAVASFFVSILKFIQLENYPNFLTRLTKLMEWRSIFIRVCGKIARLHFAITKKNADRRHRHKLEMLAAFDKTNTGKRRNIQLF